MKTLVKIGLMAWCAGALYTALGCCGAGVNHGDCGATAGTASVTASGTFTDSANNISATISGATIFVERESAGGVTSSIVELVGTPMFSSPAGATSDFVCDIGFTAAPTSGTTTQASSGVSGGVSLTVTTSTADFGYSASSAASGGGSAATGTWSLDLSSVNQFCGASDVEASVSEYTVHGSLNATMVGNAADGGTATGTLKLTF
jgi:hypothetical protein